MIESSVRLPTSHVYLGQVPDQGSRLLARMHFGHPQPASLDGIDLPLTLTPADGQHQVEQWWVAGPVDHANKSGVRICQSPDYLLLERCLPVDDGESMEAAALAVYDSLFSEVRARGFGNFVKIWNHIPDINRGQGPDERYKQFCVGRGEAFDRHFPAGDSVPAATAVGAAANRPLQVVMLASRQPARSLENPRQTAAYHYPRQYGPRSPTFARAALAPGGQVFVSGTASVVGHESLHTNNLQAQVSETMNNWQSLLGRAAEIAGTRAPGMQHVTGFRVYVREPERLADVQQLMHQAGVSNERAIYLNADICRQELLFELDGLADCGPQTAD